jgi:hypothetical protein
LPESKGIGEREIRLQLCTMKTHLSLALAQPAMVFQVLIGWPENPFPQRGRKDQEAD